MNPLFLAHVNDVRYGRHKPLKQLGSRELITKEKDVFTMSNVCPHQKSLLVTEEKHGNIVCPYHNWSFTQTGIPITSGRTESYCQNTTPLKRGQVYETCGLYFNIPIHIPELDFLNLTHMVLKEQRTDHVKADPRIVMDLFLDVDHIPTVHAGVYDIIGITDVRDVRWTYHDWGSLQLVHNNERVNAAWLAVYPGTMIEWQRGALFITVVHPTTSTTECEVEVFKYMDTEQSDLWEMNQQIWETAWSQDRAQAEKIVEFQTDTSKLEESKKHFRKFL